MSMPNPPRYCQWCTHKSESVCVRERQAWACPNYLNSPMRLLDACLDTTNFKDETIKEKDPVDEKDE